jgi:hypothetical protein
MAVGALAFVISLYMTFVRRDRYVVRDRVVDEPVDRRY